MSAEPERKQAAVDIDKWIAEARQGNREALGRLLDMCRRYLLLVANQELAPALSAKVAPSDIVQDSLMEAGRDFLRFHGSTEEELLAWLRGILRYNVADAHRCFETEKRELSREVPLDELALDEMPPNPVESPSGRAMARERDQQLEKALHQLPEHYRQVLILRMTEHLTFAQIAEKWGSTADAVRKVWGRAVEELGKLLDSPHESP